MKILTKRAKIHLATKVDNFLFREEKEEKMSELHTHVYPDSFYKNGVTVDLYDYNPNDPDSPYCMKYLTSIWEGLNNEQEGEMEDRYYKYRYDVLNQFFSCLNEFIEAILAIADFKGEVWT